ncbi:hypothetical protein D3C72_2431230 [compost metagenome]
MGADLACGFCNVLSAHYRGSDYILFDDIEQSEVDIQPRHWVVFGAHLITTPFLRFEGTEVVVDGIVGLE